MSAPVVVAAAPVDQIAEAVARGDAPDLGQAADPSLRFRCLHRTVSPLLLGGRLEQADAMLELRYPQCEVVGLLAPDDSEPAHGAV